MRQLGQLLHAQRVCPHFAITSLAQPNVEERLVRALHGFVGRKTGEFSHVTDETNSGHISQERIALGHVADLRTQFANVSLNVFAKDTSGAGVRTVKAKQCVDESRFAGAIRAEQSNASAREITIQPVKNRA